MSKHIDITDGRYEIGTDGNGYVIDVYDLSNRPEAERQMTNLSLRGWRIIASHVYSTGDAVMMTAVWEYHGAQGGLHYRKTNQHLRY